MVRSVRWTLGLSVGMGVRNGGTGGGGGLLCSERPASGGKLSTTGMLGELPEGRLWR